MWKCVLIRPAVAFLLGHKFRMDAPFLEGVPYFSREEEATARRLRDERAVYTDIDVDRADPESLKFVKAVGDEIEAWKARRGVRCLQSSHGVLG